MIGREPVLPLVRDEFAASTHIDETVFDQAVDAAAAHEAVDDLEPAGEDEVDAITGLGTVGAAGFGLDLVPGVGERFDGRPGVGRGRHRIGVDRAEGVDEPGLGQRIRCPPGDVRTIAACRPVPGGRGVEVPADDHGQVLITELGA